MRRVFDRQDDERFLEIIDARVKGAKHKDVLDRFNLTKGALAGIMSRFRESENVPCKCRRKANKDGGMPDRWWAS